MMRRMLHRFVLRPIMRCFTGFRIDGAERLPTEGPAVVVANHNSHIDTALLLAAFPTSSIDRVRPAAAADYWFRNHLLGWFSDRVIGAVPIDRSGHASDPLAPVVAALEAGDIVILFPEGTRGEPGRLAEFRPGVARLAQRMPSIPVVPVWLDGCAEVLPPHRRLPRPRRCVVRVGRPVDLAKVEPHEGAHLLRTRMMALA